ncbi:MAG: glycoside hydrolase family 16 protein, partial [Pedobacter sp.]
MHKIQKLTAILLACSISALSQSESASSKKESLIWAEEFNYKGVPDPSKWDYEEGFVRNNEKQYYTKSRLENAYVKGGNLTIESRKEQYKNANYTSASINTLGKQSFSGDFRIEVRAKLPSGKGIWPAIWMMGDNIAKVGWPKCGEFDIMEFVGQTPNTVHANIHWYDSLKSAKTSKGSKTERKDLHKKFHIYGLERKGDSISIFIDDESYLSVKADATAYKGSFSNPLYLLINTAIGGDWGGEIDDSIFPQKYYIDYIR